MNFYEYLKNDSFILLEKGFLGKRVIFVNPIDIIYTHELKEVYNVLEKAYEAQKNSYYVVGYVTYEASFCFYSSFSKAKYDFPLIWFGIYKKPIEISDNIEKKDISYYFKQTYCYSQNKYFENIEKIKAKLEEGEIYQLNFTFPLEFDFWGNGYEIYEIIREKQKVNFGAYIKQNNTEYLCFSPELFFNKDKNKIICKPMKGTISRGKNQKEDIKNLEKLKKSLKDRAENLMITDLIRNDLGKIAKIGSVKVENLFEIEKYKTVFQMTSTISAILEEDNFISLLSSLFPCGSITGAPKIRSMQFIKKFEQNNRCLYTGSIGVLKPKKSAIFNIAIRTITIKEKKATLNLGSGIVWNSKKETEYEESLLKGKFFLDNLKHFFIFESIIIKNNKCYFLEEHINRMKQTAKFFDFPFNKKYILKKINSYIKDNNLKIKVILNKNGKVNIETNKINIDNKKVKLYLSNKKVNSKDIMLKYKTSIRKLYDLEYKKALNNGYDEVIFENEKSQITEGAISNIFILKNNTYYTPPLECGVLNGIFRKKLLERQIFQEKIILSQDIKEADKIFICNSVRGIRKAVIT